MIKAIVYNQKISDSVLDSLHGFSYDIKELYIPEFRLYANLGGGTGQLFIFEEPRDDGEKERFKMGTHKKNIKLADDFAFALRDMLEQRKRIEPKLKNILK